MSLDVLFLLGWIGSAAVGVAVLVAALWWAVRSGQLRETEDARRLPLRAGLQPPPPSGPVGEEE